MRSYISRTRRCLQPGSSSEYEDSLIEFIIIKYVLYEKFESVFNRKEYLKYFLSARVIRFLFASAQPARLHILTVHATLAIPRRMIHHAVTSAQPHIGRA